MMDGMQNDMSQKIDNVQYAISRLTNLNTVQEKWKFLSQPHQNPKGILWTRIFHVHPHSTGETRFLFVKNYLVLEKLEPPLIFIFIFILKGK